MNWFQHGLMEEGGPLMWPLLGLSIIGFIFFLERIFYLHKGQTNAGRFLEGIKNLVRKRRLLEALTLCEETPGPVPRMVGAALLHYRKSRDDMRLEVQEAALAEIPLLERRIGTIAAIAKISPLLGLLGTVISILEGFYEMEAIGPYADASHFSGLMAQALVTSAAGLAISASAYLAHHFLHARLRAVIQEMEWAGNSIIQFLLFDVPQDGSDADADAPDAAATPAAVTLTQSPPAAEAPA